jgi:EAL domain-containing protein (putative c-di-GMP-specific phosphodiesterase class I)
VGEQAEATASEASARALPRLAEVLPEFARRFEAAGTFGLVLVEASSLEALETSHGGHAYARVRENLGALVRRTCEGFGTGTRVVAADSGRSEFMVFVFRPHEETRLYQGELPEIGEALVSVLESQGHRIVYPYARKVRNLGVGWTVMFRNPYFSAEMQLRRALTEAREDAKLQGRSLARERRRRFQALLLSGNLYSVYEPIVSVASKTVFGYEALVRGPEGTEFHSPAVLFEAAEEEGLIFELDCLCRRSGLRGAVDLPSGTKLFLNVRPTTIFDPQFRPEALIRTLARTELRPSDVVFEISEQESIESYSAFREVRDEYGKLGFQIAVDDTGAGYASLQAVMELEPEFIKVDRAFCAGIDTDPARQSMLRALHSVARESGAQIVAEGLDTLEELETLGRLGIPFGQGWLFGKPTPLRARGTSRQPSSGPSI